MSDSNRVEVDWAVDQIIVGARHRKDLGDIAALADSISQVGLLQLPTITPDGVLIYGARRLAAVKTLGWRTVNVWVRTGLSGKLAALMAERDDVVSHKQYSKVELADMYQELKAEIAADAARRQQATQFGSATRTAQSDGIGKLPTPLGEPTGDSRAQAAKMLGAPYKTMEKIGAIQMVAADDRYSPELRRRASEAVQQIDEGAPVDPLFITLRIKVQTEELDLIGDDAEETSEVRAAARSGSMLLAKLTDEGKLSDQEMERAAHAALERVMIAKRGKKTAAPTKPRPAEPAEPKKKTARHFVWLWGEMATWPDDYDPNTIATEVPADKWLAFKHTMSASIDFMETVDELRADHLFAA